MSPPALELIDVHAGYGRINVLHGVNLTIPRGKVLALLGPNGAGKSTTAQIAGGRLVPRSGCFHVGGNHVNGVHPAALAQAGVCTVPEGRGIFPNLTVDENLWVMTHVTPRERDEIRERAFRYFPRLGERRTQLAGTLSGGEQQMLAMSRALVSEPSLLILIVEQFADTALRVADFAAVMAHGRITAVGLPDEIASELSDAYLGGAA